MRNGVLVFLLLAMFAVILAACGGSDPTAAPAAPKPAAKAPAAKAPAAKAPAAPKVTLEDIAAKLAGGPGSIYVGDLKQLVGPAIAPSLGDADDMVNLAGLERERYLFDSEYYEALVKKANLLNPTELEYDGEPFKIAFTCINRAIATCKLVTEYLIPNINKRMEGKLVVTLSSFPELGLSGQDSFELVREGTLEWAEIYAGYIAGHLPSAEIALIYGLYPDHEMEFKVNQAIGSDLEQLFVEESGGGQVVSRMWVSGGDQFFFCQDPITDLAGFKGKKTRSHGAALSDWIEGMGASAQFVAFAEVYTALERGVLDCGVTGADPAYGQRWYEVTTYMNGPLISFFSTNNVVNSDVWNSIPADLQTIFLEEGAKAELEAHRVAAIQIDVGTEKNTRAGLEMVVFSEELQDHSYNTAVLKHVIPGWLRRLKSNDHPFVAIFNEKVQPIVGLRIEPDGSVTKTGATKR